MVARVVVKPGPNLLDFVSVKVREGESYGSSQENAVGSNMAGFCCIC